jgi:hypothetical protein
VTSREILAKSRKNFYSGITDFYYFLLCAYQRRPDAIKKDCVTAKKGCVTAVFLSCYNAIKALFVGSFLYTLTYQLLYLIIIMPPSRWNTALERQKLCEMVTATTTIMEIDDSDSTYSSGTDTIGSSSSSALSTSTASSTSTITAMVYATIQYATFFYSPLNATALEWGTRHTISDFDDATCIRDFRFRKSNLLIISNLLWHKVNRFLVGTKASIICKNRYCCPFETGLLVVLYRLSQPRRIHHDMEAVFCLKMQHLSCILSTFIHAFHQLAMLYMSDPAIYHGRMEQYSTLISAKCGNACSNVWGFIDGTLRRMCRPKYHQKQAYSGHKRAHGLKYQSVMCPDGIIALMYGPAAGSRHDSFMLGESGLLQQLRQLMPEHRTVYSLYGDPAYPQSQYIYGGFHNPPTASQEAQWNTAMSKVREAVEWGFKEILMQWAFLEFKPNMKLFKIPIGQYYIVGALLANIRNCIYGGQVNAYFNTKPMSVQEYLNLIE